MFIKSFLKNQHIIKVGLEFETGNISSAHRSMNKLCVGLCKKELDIAFLMLPVLDTSYYLTERVANYEELFPYLELLLHHYPFVVFGFGAERYDKHAILLPKRKNGISLRAIRKWKTRKNVIEKKNRINKNINGCFLDDILKSSHNFMKRQKARNRKSSLLFC